MTPSARYDFYVRQAALHHERSKTFSGRHVLKHLRTLLEIAAEHKIASALDYGCGKGVQFSSALPPDDKTLEEMLGFKVAKFDPAVHRYQKKPTGTFDMVWCVDVLEHIPEEDLSGWVIDELFGFAGKALFATAACYAAKKILPNGENAHVTIKPEEWWREQFEVARRRVEASGRQPPALTLLVG